MTDERRRTLAILATQIARGEIVGDLDRQDLARAVVDLAADVDRLTFALHQLRAHPDFEYATTKTARKSGDDPRLGLEGDGWEPNDIVSCHMYECGVLLRERWRNWDRHEFHEDNYWRRRRKP